MNKNFFLIGQSFEWNNILIKVLPSISNSVRGYFGGQI